MHFLNPYYQFVFLFFLCCTNTHVGYTKSYVCPLPLYGGSYLIKSSTHLEVRNLTFWIYCWSLWQFELLVLGSYFREPCPWQLSPFYVVSNNPPFSMSLGNKNDWKLHVNVWKSFRTRLKIMILFMCVNKSSDMYLILYYKLLINT